MKKLIIALADGFEEIEALLPADMLKRAGIQVDIAGVTGLQVTSSHGITVVADGHFAELIKQEDYDGIMLPGGLPGATNLAASWDVNHALVTMLNDGKLVAAICAAPAAVLGKAGLLEGRKATSNPGAVSHAPDVTFSTERVVIDGNLITSQGPGTAAEFAFAIISYLVDQESSDRLRKESLFL
jgi:4-methyl-5(b-hydroxyethyl)-thiazole monophosphate biosynthesis